MRQKHVYEYSQFRVNESISRTNGDNRMVDGLIVNEDGTYSLVEISNTAKKLDTTIHSVKNKMSRLLNKGILKPINENFSGEGVYLIKLVDTKNVYKIGYAKNIGKRLKSLQTTLSAFNLVGIFCKPQYSSKGIFSITARTVEKEFKTTFAKFNAKPDISDKSEFYKLSEKNVMNAIIELDKLHLKWSKSFNKLKIDTKNNGEETYKPVSIGEAQTAIKHCKIFD